MKDKNDAHCLAAWHLSLLAPRMLLWSSPGGDTDLKDRRSRLCGNTLRSRVARFERGEWLTGVLAGITLGTSNSTLYTQGLSGMASSNNVQAGLYGLLESGNAYLDLLASYARGTSQTLRQITVPGLATRTAIGQAGTNSFFGQLEGGYRIDLDRLGRSLAIPFARMQGSTVSQAAFTETGADSLNLSVAAQTTNSLRSVFGLQYASTVDVGFRDELSLLFRAGWSHEYADTSRPMTASFTGAPALPFTVSGTAIPRDGVVLGVSGSTVVAEATSAYFRYDAEIQGANASHAFSVGVRLVW